MCTNEVLAEKIRNMNKQMGRVEKSVEKISTKFDDFTDSVGKIYATKEEVNDIKETIKSNVEIKAKKSTEWIKTWGIVAVAIISAISALVPVLIK